MRLLFYDFEVFKHDWLVVIINPQERKTTTIINDARELEEFYNIHCNDIWCGYNSRNYDSYILKGILSGFNPKEINDAIINDNKKGWEFSHVLKDIQLYDYDAIVSMKSLKTLEAFMGNDIKETSVPFDINRKLTALELEETVKYCTHDVEQLIEVFTLTIEKFNAHIDLIKTFKLPLSYISKTQAQLTACILDCRRKQRFDEWDIQLVDTLKISRYSDVVRWFTNKDNYSETMTLNRNICGIPHSFGLGGLHGCIDKPVHLKGLILHIDVTSFYPSIMIKYNLLTRNSKTPSKYKEIYDKRVQLKKEGKKKEQAPYKIVLNSTYGICNDKYSTAYDPRQARNVCINGQLLLLDLLEHLEGHCELIQSNTDGIIIRIPNTDSAFNLVDDICYEWEQRTGMCLDFSNISEIYQKDVNNYIMRFKNGKLKRKGAFVKESNELDNDIPIVNEAIVKYLIEKIDVSQTILENNYLINFQKVVKISSKYSHGWHNGKTLNDRTFRVFASKDTRDTFIGKQKNGKSVEKFANTPIHCFIENGNVKDMKVPAKLDKGYYIELAKERLRMFGEVL